MSGSSHPSTGGRDTQCGRRQRRLCGDIRGVQWTLEAFLAVLLLLAALVVVASVLPLGTQQAEAELAQTQLQQAGDDVLDLAAAQGNLTAAVLYWNTSAGAFVHAEANLTGDPHYVSFDGAGSHPLAALLNDTLGERPVSYNIHLEYETETDVTERRPVVYQGPPGGDSVIASTTVLLQTDDVPQTSAGNCTLAELDNSSACGSEVFYAPDATGVTATSRYTTVQIQIELWRV